MTAQGRRGRRSQRGLSESVQYAVLLPLLLICTLGIIEAGIWVHGHNVALGAARAGAEAARGTDGSSGSALTAAQGIAEQGGLESVSVWADRRQTEVVITVSARIPLILDLGLGRITETAAAPVERVTQP